jgi:hypothetical protein
MRRRTVHEAARCELNSKIKTSHHAGIRFPHPCVAKKVILKKRALFKAPDNPAADRDLEIQSSGRNFK